MGRSDLEARIAAIEVALDPKVHDSIMTIDDCRCPLCADPARSGPRYRVLGALRNGVVVSTLHIPDNGRG